MLDNLMKIHLDKISQETLYDKNGLLIYTYNDNIREKGYANPKGVNIGDYIQTLAARQFIPEINNYTDRDQLGIYAGDNINMIVNGWHYFWEKNKIFSKKIKPLFVSFHINNPEQVSKETLKYLKENEPIGCRDYNTRDFLLKNDIKAYFSACLTLTLGETYRIKNEERNNNIYFVGYKIIDDKINPIDKKIKEILENFPENKIFYKTHHYPLNTDYKGCLYEAQSLLKDYAKAKLVITTKIHCALPCLALGTPVILIMPQFDRKRFKGIYNLLNYIGFDENNNFICKINKDEYGNITNTTEYLKYANYLKEICMSFMKIKQINHTQFNKVDFIYHKTSKKYLPISKFKLFKKIKNGSKRILVIFGFIKIIYNKL